MNVPEVDLDDFSNPSDESEDNSWNITEGLPEHEDTDSGIDTCILHEEEPDESPLGDSE